MMGDDHPPLSHPPIFSHSPLLPPLKTISRTPPPFISPAVTEKKKKPSSEEEEKDQTAPSFPNPLSYDIQVSISLRFNITNPLLPPPLPLQYPSSQFRTAHPPNFGRGGGGRIKLLYMYPPDRPAPRDGFRPREGGKWEWEEGMERQAG